MMSNESSNNCNQIRRQANLPYPRTCAQCGLGPCNNKAPAIAVTNVGVISPKRSAFERELSDLINRYGEESGGNTPDFILASYLQDCLTTFNKATVARERWHGRMLDASATTNHELEGG